MYDATVGQRVRILAVPETGYSAKIHNKFAGMTGTVTHRYSCPCTVMVVFDSAIMRNGFEIKSNLFSVNTVEPETEDPTKN